MPHPVGGAMGVTLSHRRFDIISLNIHKTTSRRGWKSRAQDCICMAVVL